MSTQYSGSLQRKTKAELQEIAQALAISDAGMKDELQQRIKRHLDDNNDELEADPVFAGLYNRRRRQGSIQPAGGINGHARSSDAAHFDAITEERESSPIPAVDARDVSMMLPHAPLSPIRIPAGVRGSTLLKRMSPAPSTRGSPIPPSPAKSIIAEAMEQPEVQAAVQMQRNFAGNLLVTFTMARNFLSNGRNLFVLSGFVDVLAILLSVHGGDSVYPMPLQTSVLALAHWAMPTLVIPAVLGYFISFSSPSPGFDSLSAAIVKAAAAAAYPFPRMILAAAGTQVQSLDVLGSKWRGVSAGVTVAFAFAEAIAASNASRRTAVAVESGL